ncbi:CLUMA_CG021392, isoform A [Clunio marinus]|uniref:lysozyme n=1 Tax=Clunio marinus TaxID=568069 RepID=A0A1J1JCB4_9DIPT|nr:CLUMA_CG021392, isoform A [Clunio marinus]
MKTFYELLIVLSITSSLVDSKMYLSCELAKEFAKNDMERHLIPHWICLVQAESQGNTSKMVEMPNLTANYGIFQINSKDWCGKDKKGGNCNIKCSDLLNDDIKDDIKCAKEVFNRNGLNGWKGVCLIEAESGGDSSKVTEFPNLSTSYGIFQINSKEWCRKGRRGGECGARCEDFLTEDIKLDIKCAKVIYDRHGFKHWKGWLNRCKQRPLPDVSKCSYSTYS